MQIKTAPTTRQPGIISNNNIIKETECGESYDVRRNSLFVKGVSTKVEKVIYKILGSGYCLYFFVSQLHFDLLFINLLDMMRETKKASLFKVRGRSQTTLTRGG